MRTLATISPLWNKWIKTGKCPDPKLNICKSEFCIVGEAHGFTSDYFWNMPLVARETEYCSECNKYARILETEVVIYGITSKRVKEPLKDFVKHWNQAGHKPVQR